MLTIVAFIVALAVLIAVHEYGHYRMAVACGVRVLRFSVGFGRTVWRWQPSGSPTEFVIGILPLGGYVKMLDEREAPVAPELRHLAFNNQSLAARSAIVAAGPLVNLLLAVLLYAMVNWSGVEQPRALLASPIAGSVAEQAGIVGGELVTMAALDGDALDEMRSFDDLRWLLAQGALRGLDVRLVLSTARAPDGREHLIRLSKLEAVDVDTALFRRIGIVGPLTRPVLGELVPDGAAVAAGLKPGDLVVQVGPTRILDGQQLRDEIRASVRADQTRTSRWQVQRDGLLVPLDVTPSPVLEAGQWIGKIGAFVGSAPELVIVRYGPIDGLWRGMVRTWEVSGLTLRMIGSMITGQASLKNLSGPLTIADYAGKSANQGLTQYLLFLALISVSLGVLNLLPLPVLDGGHLMYYLWEAVTGKAVSEAWLDRLQRGGVTVLLLMMGVALFNDLTRILG